MMFYLLSIENCDFALLIISPLFILLIFKLKRYQEKFSILRQNSCLKFFKGVFNYMSERFIFINLSDFCQFLCSLIYVDFELIKSLFYVNHYLKSLLHLLL